ncbi:MAG: Flp family type IVb pilin [Actinomycetota bacterium]|nr:Flp family type IVb pilin [Actinomycetota bacterium]
MVLQAYTYVKVGMANVRMSIHQRLTRMIGSEVGATAAEYALLVSLIAIAIVIGASHLGSSINTRLDKTAACVNDAPTC